MKFKVTAPLVSPIAYLLFLLTSHAAFATLPTAQIQAAIGSGVFFYAWNANGHCSMDTSINPTGKCPVLWTDTIKNINAPIPASADRAKIKFIYLDFVSFNLHPATLNTQTIFKVGGCTDGASADITFCSTGASYSNPQSESGYTAASELSIILGPGYYMVPAISANAIDAHLMNLSSGQFQSLAYSLACIVNPQATPPSWASGFSGGPSSCSDIFLSDFSHPQAPNPTYLNGLALDIESPDLIGNANNPLTDPTAARDFYTALQSSMGSNSPVTTPQFIMVSTDPAGLTRTQNHAGGETFGTILEGLQKAGQPTFIFSPQVYDECYGLAAKTAILACPISMPFTYVSPDYVGSIFFQALPATPMDDSSWAQSASDNGIPFQKLAFAPFLFFNTVYNRLSPNPYPDIPLQLMISGGGSTQIWSHTNLYNADFQNSNPTDDPFITGVASVTGAPVSFQPSMIYQNKKACQAENPDGSLGATIPNCVSYPNPYSETLASYANTLFTSLQYTLGSNNNAPAFSGITLYPFTPYGFWDETCGQKSTICQGVFPEVPDGLINGQKPQISFWDVYLNQFANQWIGSSTGTIPTQASIPGSKLFVTLPTGYYQLNPGSENNLGTATVLFNTATYPNGQIPTISNYRANLIDAIGQIIATGTSSSSPIIINHAPGGNYKLEVQALDQNNNVIASTEAAAEGPGLPPVLTAVINNLTVSNTSSTGYTLSWTLNCTTPPSNMASLTSAYAGNSPNPQYVMTGGASPASCGTQSASFKGANNLKNGTVMLTVVNSNTLLPITNTLSASLSIQAS